MAIDIGAPLKKFIPHLLKAQEENLNEADTIQRLVKVFEEVLGYDALTEITREKQVKGKYVDIAMKLGGVIRLLVEAKAAGTTLRDRHIEQAQHYAAEGNIRWVLLTNGVMWNLYHLSFEEGIEYERAFSVDLSSDPIQRATQLLGLLHRQSILKGEHETFWQHRAALSPGSIAKALFTEEVLGLVRRKIRKREGILIDQEDLASGIQGMFSAEARERIGPVRVARKKAPKIVKPKQEVAPTPVSAEQGISPASPPSAEDNSTKSE